MSESSSELQARLVDDAITGRRSIRRFLPRPVSREQVRELLDVAARAPSGTNMQPWHVIAVAGERKQELSRKLSEDFNAPDASSVHVAEYSYYPTKWFSPYVDRRRKVGLDLYKLLGIGKGETLRMHEQHGRNLLFFDAPVGLIFTIDRALTLGSWLDYGMFLQNVMVAARARGLDTCPQAMFANFHRVVAQELGVDASHMIVCGMSLGYADPDAPENQLITERVAAADFTRFEGW